ncbi:MAG TPA: hypothetical protein VEO54_00685 [Thermoanaerobaculia bacterium]|nr:hypothetical protein [Thermoanaerobaculia bacterium]
MKQNAKRTHRKVRRGRDRGSALLVSLMVMVGLSLLGLSFVAISETENAISVNERNKAQTAALAEAGAKAVVQWFQDPEKMKERKLLPDNDPSFKNNRQVNAYSGVYKPEGLLFDLPYGPQESDMFFGDEAHADILIIDKRNDASTKFIKDFNDNMFYGTDAGRVTAIRIYAPPNVGGSLINGFWVAGQRYGVATIAVTAEKRNSLDNVVAQSICRLVLAPFPLPGPSGAIQALGSVDTNGAYEVHWGAIESEKVQELFIKREVTALPWFDAYDHPYVEYGLDSSVVWEKNKNYAPYAHPQWGLVVRPTDATIAAKHEYRIVSATGPSGGTEPAWDVTPGNTNNYGGNVTYKEVPPTAYPISTGTGAPYPGYNNHNWIVEMLHRPVTDPWFHVRTRGTIKGKDTGTAPAGPHPFPYASQAIANAGDFSTSANKPYHYFQNQTINNRPEFKQVRVPRFDYDFWKAAALGGRGQQGVWYLQWVSGENYTNGLETKSMQDWVKNNSGFFFFETKNNMNPQNDGPGVLVPGDGNPCGAKGVVYMNVESLKTTGAGCDGEDGWYNQPPEPYRDIGYRKVNEVGSGSQAAKNFTTDGAGNYVKDKAFNHKWDWQDLPWANGGSGKNGIFDVCVQQRVIRRESDNSDVTEYVPLPYYPGCTLGNNISTPNCTCSEPFEPYINIHYAGDKEDLEAYWDNPTASSSVFAKVTNDEKPTGTPVACSASAVASKKGQEQCATNAWDGKGALALIDGGGGHKPISIEGVVYNEGDYESTGNAAYYGSVVVGGKVSPQGTQEIWYDACLAGDCWPPKHIPFPRVMITSTQIQ